MMHDYAVGLARRGHHVEVLTTDALDGARRAVPPEEVMAGVRVRRLPNVSNSLAWHTKKYLPRGLVTRLAREIDGFDVVHVTDTRTYLTAAAYLAARVRGVPFCLSAHGSLPESTGLRGAVKRVYDTALVRPMLRSAAGLFAQTSHEAALYRRLGGTASAVRVLPLPIDIEQVASSASTLDFRARLGIAPSSRVILFLGRIHPLKGLDVLIESAQPLLGTNTVLAVVGRDDGQWASLATRYRTLITSGQIRFAGALYGADRFGAYRAADVFALTPRHWEETSVAALEAAACGTALVLTEQAEVPGLEAARGGFIVELDRRAIHDALVAVLQDASAFGQRARLLVERQHEVSTVVERLEQYLWEATTRQPGGRPLQANGAC